MENEPLGLYEDEPVNGGNLEPVTHIKRYIVYAVGDSTEGGDGLEALSFRLKSLDDAEGKESGSPIGSISLQDWIADIAKRGPMFISPDIRSNPPETPLDVVITEPCQLVFHLYGDFWKFMPVDGNRKVHRIKAKKPKGKPTHAGRYAEVLGWNLGPAGASPAHDGAPCNTISMRCGKPTKADPNGNHERHGFNFYIRMKNGAGPELPIIIDPNVENKGGNP